MVDLLDENVAVTDKLAHVAWQILLRGVRIANIFDISNLDTVAAVQGADGMSDDFRKRERLTVSLNDDFVITTHDDGFRQWFGSAIATG
jgi:hypothetical protein